MKDRTIQTIVLVIIGVLIFTLFTCAFCAKHHDTKSDSMLYAKTAVVTTIDRVHGYVGFTDKQGSEWFWWCDTDSAPWALDDAVLLVMDNNGTAWMYDDEIVSITTEGIIYETVTK